jgi:hypothetical protein
MTMLLTEKMKNGMMGPAKGTLVDTFAGVQKSPIPGMPLDIYNKLVALADRDPAAAAAINRGGNAAQLGPNGKQNKEGDTFRDFMALQIAENFRKMNEYIHELEEIADFLRTRIAENNAKIKENNDWIDERTNLHKAAAEADAFYEHNGYYQRNPDGTFKNQAFQRLLDEYGKNPESDNAAHIYFWEKIEDDQREIRERTTKNTSLTLKTKQDAENLDVVTQEAKKLHTSIKTAEQKYSANPQKLEEESKKILEGINNRRETLRTAIQVSPDDVETVSLLRKLDTEAQKANISPTKNSSINKDDGEAFGLTSAFSAAKEQTASPSTIQTIIEKKAPEFLQNQNNR